LSHRVIGAAIEVHRHIGPGFLESVYEEAVAIEMTLREIPHTRQVPIHVAYKGHRVGEGRMDFLVDDLLVVEIKAVEHLAPIHAAQGLSYLRTTHRRVGLLINFNVPVLKDGLRRLSL
jgi:GxxExxY protein